MASKDYYEVRVPSDFFQTITDSTSTYPLVRTVGASEFAVAEEHDCERCNCTGKDWDEEKKEWVTCPDCNGARKILRLTNNIKGTGIVTGSGTWTISDSTGTAFFTG